ncbi:MAG: homocysteine biosynthesis protein [Actinobacteria bacterium]|nr:homocysteine biosynthesis protein [Actinomycetota bacterium]MCG2788471.1 homocysteine biosynthesis protein [Actinomycetes bacterium]
MAKTLEEINKKIKNGSVVVLNAEEIIDYAEQNGVKKTARDIDVVTTATFGPMCSTGAFLSFGHSDPPIKMSKVWLNDVPAYAGIAAVDVYIGATELSETEDMNYGGAYVIEDLISGKPVKLRATAYGTDCYPRKEIETYITLESINQAYIFNPRNVYQNYAAATNSSNKTIYTYMGKLMPNFGNITFSSAGQLSPLLNDPYYRTIGIGTRIFIGGGQGYVAWQGTQHNPGKDRLANGTPSGPAGTLALIGDMKKMNKNFIRAATFHGYGITMYVGVGIPIPVLDEEMVEFLKVKDEDIYTEIMDYSVQRRNKPSLGKINYKQLKSGSIMLKGKKIQTGSFSSYAKALEIANLLKSWITKGHFLMTNFTAPLPWDEKVNTLNILSKEEL